MSIKELTESMTLDQINGQKKKKTKDKTWPALTNLFENK